VTNSSAKADEIVFGYGASIEPVATATLELPNNT
jgi:hypothetical protein